MISRARRLAVVLLRLLVRSVRSTGLFCASIAIFGDIGRVAVSARIRNYNAALSKFHRTMKPVAPELATPVPSPCVSLCKMNREIGYCEGCLRTIDEIVAWGRADDDFKRAVWADLPRREQLIDFD